MKIQIRDIKYHVRFLEKNTRKSPLILLHGFLGSGHSFDRLIPYLKKRAQIIRIDLLGHGRTDGASTSTRFSTEEQLQDLERLIEKLSVENLFLYGYSMGGRLALRYALNNSSRLRGLILESTHTGVKSEKDRQKRHEKDQRWANQIRSDFHDFLSWWHQLDLFKTYNPPSDQRYKHYNDIQYSQRSEQMALSLEGFGQGAVPPVHQKISSLSIPTLLGAGAEDPKYVRRMKEMYSRFPNAKLHIMEGAAHRLHLDQPVQWSKQVKNFILNTGIRDL